MPNINAAKDEVFATLFTMNATMTQSEMVEKEWSECEEAVAVETDVSVSFST